jgi:hypothetical protein
MHNVQDSPGNEQFLLQGINQLIQWVTGIALFKKQSLNKKTQHITWKNKSEN